MFDVFGVPYESKRPMIFIGGCADPTAPCRSPIVTGKSLATFGVSVMIVLTPITASAAPDLRVVVKILTSLGAAESLSRASRSLQEYADGMSTLSRLEEQGVDCERGAIYAVRFHTSAGYWADWFSKPDVFFTVHIEGEGSYLVPQIYTNYEGGQILESVVAREAKPGSQIVVRVLDDDGSSDEVWNALLPKVVRASLTSEITSARPGFPMHVSEKGTINVELRGVTSKLVLDAPDAIAEAIIDVPSAASDGWSAQGQLYDSDGNTVGAIDFAPLWIARNDPEYSSLKRQLPKLLGSGIYWLVLGICSLTWYLRSALSSKPAVSS